MVIASHRGWIVYRRARYAASELSVDIDAQRDHGPITDMSANARAIMRRM
jgi:hypothetical protein